MTDADDLPEPSEPSEPARTTTFARLPFGTAVPLLHAVNVVMQLELETELDSRLPPI